MAKVKKDFEKPKNELLLLVLSSERKQPCVLCVVTNKNKQNKMTLTYTQIVFSCVFTRLPPKKEKKKGGVVFLKEKKK